LQQLPQVHDVWQADFRQMPNWIKIGNMNVRPWMILVASRSNDLILATELAEEQPAAAAVWDALAKSIQQPAAGKPHRPTELHVRPHDAWQSLKPQLEQLAIRLCLQDDLDQVDFMLQEMAEQIAGPPQPGLLDVPGITPEQVARFYDAAASFFQQAPWKKVGFKSAIRIECANYQSGPWFGILMGQSGLTTGLALYDDIRLLRKLLTGSCTDKESAHQTVATTVTFEEESAIPVADLDAAQLHGWKVARADAYPSIFRKELGQSIRPPLAWELELMEGCLRVIPEFIQRQKQDDPTVEELAATSASGPQVFKLAWVVD
jgi:hypothetical protein